MLLTKFDPFRGFIPTPYYHHDEKGVAVKDNVMAFSPKTNTRESENSYHIEVELPGLSKEDISIDLKDNKLTVFGQRELKKEVKEEDYYKVESSFGKFQRQFSLPEDIDKENISANSNNGVLEVTIPKLEERVTKKRIEIK